MDERGEHTGLIGVGFLFGLISLFLLVVCLQATGHAKLAAGFGLAGSAVLAVLAGWFLLRKWRQAPNLAAFDEDGDVPFCGAVFLLASMALAVGLARVAGIALSRALPLAALLCAAALLARLYFQRTHRGYPGT
jgi:hypothetical protein